MDISTENTNSNNNNNNNNNHNNNILEWNKNNNDNNVNENDNPNESSKMQSSTDFTSRIRKKSFFIRKVNNSQTPPYYKKIRERKVITEN